MEGKDTAYGKRRQWYTLPQLNLQVIHWKTPSQSTKALFCPWEYCCTRNPHINLVAWTSACTVLLKSDHRVSWQSCWILTAGGWQWRKKPDQPECFGLDQLFCFWGWSITTLPSVSSSGCRMDGVTGTPWWGSFSTAIRAVSELGCL